MSSKKGILLSASFFEQFEDDLAKSSEKLLFLEGYKGSLLWLMIWQILTKEKYMTQVS